jgi:superfamily II DNA helicase RecQ
MNNDWGIRYPHDWQVQAIHDLAFHCNRHVYLIAKTGSGKLAVPLKVRSMQTGVTLSMIPLVGLGSDQVKKSSNASNLIEAYHLDEMRGVHGDLLCCRLRSLNQVEADNVSIFLYASPQSLIDGSPWIPSLNSLASCGFLRLIYIDEAHTVAQDGRSFRPEFRTAVRYLKSLKDSIFPSNLLAMSATSRSSGQKTISDLLGRQADKVIWLELS